MGKVIENLRTAVLAAASAHLTPAAQAEAAAGSAAVKVGAVFETACGEKLSVYRTPNGGALIFGNQATALGFDPAALAALAKLLAPQADAAAMALVAPLANEPLDWTADDNEPKWRAALPDSRTAVIEQLADADGQPSSFFLPTVHESRDDFETGPVCGSLLDAARWCARTAEQDAG